MVHTISSIPGTSRESTVIQITDIRCIRKMIGIPHLVRGNVYFESAPKPAGQEVAKEK